MSGIPSWCRSGQKVAYVEPAYIPADENTGRLVHGHVYTIRRVGTVEEGWGDAGEVEVFLHEFYGPYDENGAEIGFAVEHFRPVVEAKIDNEIEAQIYHKKGLHQSAPRRKSVEA